MSENFCSICRENFEDKYFDEKQNKCILHSNKRKSKVDYKSLDYKKLCYSFKEYLNNYLDEINIKIEHNEYANIYDDNIEYKIENIKFPFIGKLWEDEDDINLFSVCKYNINISFLNCTFYEGFDLEKNVLKNNLSFKSCKFFKDSKFKNIYDNKIEFLECKEIENLDFSFGKFNDKVRIKNCNINNVNFHNSVFNELTDFYKTTFFTTNFNKTDFNDISVFTEATFKENVEFKYTTFNKLCIFRNTVFKKEVDLTDSIFNVKGNFLGISSNKDKYQDIKVSNRETARIIKDSFEQQNNIIEANKFYKLEMKERLLEFKKAERSDNNILERFIFLIHWISSNHSQSWFVSIFWIVNLTFIYSSYSIKNFMTQCTINPNFDKCKHYLYLLDSNITSPIIDFIQLYVVIPMLIFSLPLLILWKSEERHILYSSLIYITILMYFIYEKVTNDFYLSYFSSILNPFSIMTEFSELTFLTLVYKVTIAYLIYQLIVSIRQNTRRK